MATLTVDVAVAGGGLIGAAAALALAQRNLSVALIDRGEPPVTRGTLGFDIRTVALNPASVELLEAIGAWRAFAPCPFSAVHVCEERGTRFIEFHASDVDRAELGWIVEVSPSIAALWGRLRHEPNVTVVTGSIDRVDAASEHVRLRALVQASGTTHSATGRASQAAGASADVGDANATDVTATLLIAADGANSSIRHLLGVDAGRFATGQSAIATIVEIERDHGGVAWQRFMRDGPLAFLPLPSRDGKHFASIVFSQLDAAADALMALDDAAFARKLRQASGDRFGAIRAVDKRFRFPLEQLVADSFQPAPRVLLVGDAARVLHPLAGQGVNLGFEDLAEVLRVASSVPRAELGDAELWKGFARRRRLRADVMVRAMDAFATAYRLQDPTLNWLRNVVVDVLNAAPPLKRQLIKEAMGFGIFAPPR
ncbi:MAG TPA: FAD-dependent oxidoreductase [Pseudomonadales bacterium]|nr:FAD-dependent oxidoreductase [Pseudomonadales bacterium]